MSKRPPVLLSEPSNYWPAADDRPRTAWLKIGTDGPPAYLGYWYEVADYPYYKHPSQWVGHPGARHGQVVLMQYLGTCFKAPGLSISGFLGNVWYRGLARREDSALAGRKEPHWFESARPGDVFGVFNPGNGS